MRRRALLIAAILAALVPHQPVAAAGCAVSLWAPDPPSTRYDFNMVISGVAPGQYAMRSSRPATVTIPAVGTRIDPVGPATDFKLELQFEGTKLGFKFEDPASPDIAVRILGDDCDASGRWTFPTMPPTATGAPDQRIAATGQLDMPFALVVAGAVGFAFQRRRRAVRT